MSAHPGINMRIANELSLVMMVIERCSPACLMAERVMNTMVLVLWRYLRELQRRMHFTMKQNDFT